MDKNSNNNIQKVSDGTLFPLSSVGGKKLEVSFTAPDLSSCGGLLLMKECEQQIGFISALSNCVIDNRNQSLIEHTYEEMITQRVFQIAAGYEDADDCDLLRNDSILKICAGRTSEGNSLGSQPTISRLENKMTPRELYQMGVTFIEQFQNSYTDEPEAIIVDCDDTNSDTHGSQQLTIFNGYYGEYCYMPLFIFEGITGKLMLPVLRPGQSNKSVNICGLLIRIIQFLRKRWKKTRFILRGDSHFCSKDFMDWAEDKVYVEFTTGLTANSVLYKRVDNWVKNAQKDFKRYNMPSTSYHQFTYKAESWRYSQRVVVKIEVSEKGTNIRFVVTSFKNQSSRFIYETVYCGRGNMELMIKEVKTYLFADRMSCSRFKANQFRLFLHSAAYVLLHTMKTKMFAGTQIANYSILTIRDKLLLSAVLIKELKSKIVVQFSKQHPLYNEMALALRNVS